MKNLLIAFTALALSSGTAFANQDVKDACAADVATTGCKGEGKEKMKCLRNYKQANKDFKFSEDCKLVFKQQREENIRKRDELKAKHGDKKEVKKDTK